MSTLVLRAATRLLTPVILALSVYLLLRGHNAPGGGFIAALVAGAAVVLQYLANGPEGLNRFLRVHVNLLVGWGLLLAVGFGVAGILAGGEFLQSTLAHARVPVLGEVKVAASLVFDLGVYLVVLAVVVTIVRYLGEPT